MTILEATEHGYNLYTPTERTRISESTRQRMRQSALRRLQNPEYKAQLQAQAAKAGRANTGKKSIAHRLKMSQGQQKRYLDPNEHLKLSLAKQK